MMNLNRMLKVQSLASVLFLSFLHICFSATNDSELKISLKTNGESAAEISLRIEGDFATTKVMEITERFNLKEMSWLDSTGSNWVTLEECKKWAEASKIKSSKSAEFAPKEIRQFILWSLNPIFNVEKQNDVLRLTSGQIDYMVEGQASKKSVENYFRYALLNAYKKGITEKKLPPFAEIKAVAEMEKLGYITCKINITIPAIPNAPKIEMQIVEIKPKP
jgi:hypothetical protein